MQPSTPDICKEFYGFRDMPFSMVDEGVQNNIFFSQNFGTSLAILVSSLDKYVTLTLLIGEEGVGKTTLINYLFNHIQQDFIVGKIIGRALSTQQLLQQILISFSQTPVSEAVDALLHQLQEFLSVEFEKQNGQSSLLIIDDADNMPVDALKGVELLLGLNSENRQLIQLILVGNSKLEQMLNAAGLHNLKKIARTRCLLQALTAEETQLYIQHRLSFVGKQDKPLFDEKVCSVIFNYSKGVPKKINTICNDALLLSCSTRINRISTELINEAANDSEPRIQLALSSASNKRIGDKFFRATLLTGLIVTSTILVFLFQRGSFFSFFEDNRGKAFQNKYKNDNYIFSNTEPDRKHATILKDKPLEAVADSEIWINDIKREVSKFESAGQNSNQQAKNKIANLSGQIASIAPKSNIKKKSQQKPKAKPDPEQTKLSVVASQQKNNAKKKTVILTENKTITELLTKAEQQLSDSKFTVPKKDNAYQTYKQILTISPNNKRALDGLQRIANHYLILAKKQRSKGNLKKSLLLIDQGLKIFPRHNKLSLLKEQLVAELKHNQEEIFAALEIREAVDNQLNKLLKQAENQRKAQQLIQPPGMNAVETYNKILQIDPNNIKAKTGLKRIANQFKTMGETALANGNNIQALAIVKKGLAVFGSDPELLALRGKIVLQKNAGPKKTEVPENKKQKEDEDDIRPFATF